MSVWHLHRGPHTRCLSTHTHPMEDDLLVGNTVAYVLNFSTIRQEFELLGAPPEAVAAATVALAGFLDTVSGLSATHGLPFSVRVNDKLLGVWTARGPLRAVANPDAPPALLAEFRDLFDPDRRFAKEADLNAATATWPRVRVTPCLGLYVMEAGGVPRMLGRLVFAHE